MVESAAIEFMNSLTPEGNDLLCDRGWTKAALERWDLPARKLGADELQALVDLRTLLRSLAGTVSSGRMLSGRQLAALNEVIGSSPVRAKLQPLDDGYVVVMTPLADTWIQLALRQLAGSFTSILRASRPPRLRLCANESCRRAFWDESRNRTRRWCDPAGCGNRMRVRRHRARSR